MKNKKNKPSRQTLRLIKKLKRNGRSVPKSVIFDGKTRYRSKKLDN